MKKTEIIEHLRNKLSISCGRHLYGVVGTYEQLQDFTKTLREARTADGKKFPNPMSVNDHILHTIPDDDFRKLVENEAKRPEPTRAHIEKAFVAFLKQALKERGLIVLWELELLFAYQIELGSLRVHATDEKKIILLLPGRRSAGKIIMFPDWEESSYTLPGNLIAENHLWKIG